MSIFNRAWNATKRTAKKISDKTEELIDSATLSVKIKNLEAKIDEHYEALGRIVYRDLHTEDDLEEEKLEAIAAIDALFDRIAALKAEKEAAEAKKKEAAAAEEAPAEEAEAAEEAPAEEPAPEKDAE